MDRFNEMMEKYNAKFGEFPPTFEMKNYTLGGMADRMEEAIQENEPIKFEYDEDVYY